MIMYDDPLKRSWVELAHANPDLIPSFRKVLLGFHSSDLNVKMGTAGTGFIVAKTSDWFFFLTAKHILEGVLTIQRPHVRFDGGPFSIAGDIQNVTLGGKVKVSIFNDEEAYLADVLHLSFNKVTDIAVGIAEIPETLRSGPWWNIPLGIDLPNVGDPIHLCSLIHKAPKESEGSGKGRKFAIERGVTVRKGVVTGVYPKGLNQYNWPCFTTSIPTVAGMSGGFSYNPLRTDSVAANGIISAELSNSDPTNYYECGESLIICSWLALANTVPSKIPRQSDDDDLSLYEMVTNGQFPAPVGDFHRIQFSRQSRDEVLIGVK